MPTWRSLLFVPVNVEKFIDKAPSVGADAVQLDLEDAVAASEKDAARKMLVGAARRVRSEGADVTVRINRPWRLAVRDLEEAVVPEIDLKAGHVVRGIGGQREKYRPIRSCLVDSSLPIDVAVAIREAFGFEEFYLADLDAIEGAAPALDIYSELIAEGTRLLIDAGPANRRCAEQLAEFADQHRSFASTLALALWRSTY